MTTTATATSMVSPHMPSAKVLAALGRVTIRHAYLDTVLKGTIKTLAELTAEETWRALEYEGSRSMREMARKLATGRFGKANKATLQLIALLNNCGKLTDKRNEYVHSLWITNRGGRPLLLGGGKVPKAPSAAQLNKLAEDIFDAACELNKARLQGFLHEAMKEVVGTKTIKQAKKAED